MVVFGTLALWTLGGGTMQAVAGLQAVPKRWRDHIGQVEEIAVEEVCL